MVAAPNIIAAHPRVTAQRCLAARCPRVPQLLRHSINWKKHEEFAGPKARPERQDDKVARRNAADCLRRAIDESLSILEKHHRQIIVLHQRSQAGANRSHQQRFASAALIY